MSQIILGQEWTMGVADPEGTEPRGKLFTLHLTYKHFEDFTSQVNEFNARRSQRKSVFLVGEPVVMDACNTLASYLESYGGNCEVWPISHLDEFDAQSFASEDLSFIHRALWFKDPRETILNFAKSAGQDLGLNIEEYSHTGFLANIIHHALQLGLIDKDEINKAFCMGLDKGLCEQAKYAEKRCSESYSARMVKFALETQP